MILSTEAFQPGLALLAGLLIVAVSIWRSI
jgi:hypothetical protein